MKKEPAFTISLRAVIAAFLMLASMARAGENPPVTRDQLFLLQQQNQQMQQQLQKQQELIDSLTRKVAEIQDANAKRDEAASKDDGKSGYKDGGPLRLGKINIGGEGGIAFFNSQRNGATPNSEFRIDEARLFLDAPVWNDVYFFSEMNLATREYPQLELKPGEIYLDFEDVSKLWGRERMLNVRAGRFYVPFGEEYLSRYAIDNPLISHSVSDLWGEDEGVEIFGSIGKFQYALAVQNGGPSETRDFTEDKSIAGRISYDPAPWLHLSVSGMRTGDLDFKNDGWSEMWFGGGWIAPVGSTNTTRFHGNLVEGDAHLKLSWLQLKGAGGYINYGDNDPLGNNHRDIYYYYVEGVHDFTRKFYGAARYSQIFARNGVPIIGNGPMAAFFGPRTTDYWRLSFGLGYHLSSGLLLKGEYSFNQGRLVNGAPRLHEDLFALEAAFKF